jgi:hypothetical protein
MKLNRVGTLTNWSFKQLQKHYCVRRSLADVVDRLQVNDKSSEYVRVHCEHAHCSVNSPRSWHFSYPSLNSPDNPMNAYYISVERIDEGTGQLFKTGLTIRFYKHLSLQCEQSVREYCSSFFQCFQMSDRKKILLLEDYRDTAATENQLALYKCAYTERNFGEQNPHLQVYWKLLANLSTGSLFEFCFESPIAEFENHWREHGKYMLDTIQCETDK